MRTLLALVVIAGVGALGWYVFQRPTIASGQVFADQLLDDHPTLKTVTCDEHYVIGVDGGSFHCAIVAKDGDSERVSVALDRAGMYHIFPVQSAHPEHRHVPATTDPWE